MHRIVFLDRDTIPSHIVIRPPAFPHDWVDHPRTLPEETVARLQGVTVAVTNKVRLGAAELEQLPELKMIAVAATGTDHVDKAWCKTHGVVVSNIRGYAINAVPEHTFALLLALQRAVSAYHRDILNGDWQRIGQFCFFAHRIKDLHGKRLGIVGAGVLGKRVAELGAAFGMTPLFAGRKGRATVEAPYTPFDEVLESCDVLSLHAPLTPETRGMIAMSEFRRMKRAPILINTARGGIVVEEDLERALDEGLVSAAGIDVTLPEPPPADSAIMRLARRPNVIVTPHIAWASDEALQTLADQLIDNIEAFAAGAPRNVVEA